MSKILVFAGSARKDSFNKKLARIAAACVEEAGGSATFIDLADYPMPIYDGDLEQNDGVPSNGQKLYDIFKDHSGLLVSCPEYNSSMAPLFKNTIDWVSRPRKGDPQLAAYKGKVAGLISASPGALGGLRGLVDVRAMFQSIGVMVVPTQYALSKAHEAFGDDGSLNDDAQRQRVLAVAREVVDVVKKMSV